MTADNYILKIISKYKKESGPESTAQLKSEKFIPVIRGWAGEVLQSISFSGSSAKGTAVLGSTDIDLLIALDVRTSGTLFDIYENLFNYLESGNYSPFRKEFSIGVVCSGVSFDLMPAFKNSDGDIEHILLNTKTRECIQTNIKTHIGLIANSGRLNEIRAIKIWRNLNGFKFPSFYLELSVLDALHNRSKNQLAKNFMCVIEYFIEYFREAKIIDPANPKNVISDLLTAEEKTFIVQAAQKTRTQANWDNIIW